MKKLKLIVSIGVLSLLVASPVLAQQNLDITGSNTLFPIMENAAAAYQEDNSDVSIDVSGPGSGAGITALIDGQTDLAPMSRAPKDAEVGEAICAGIELQVDVVGKDALIVIVNNDNPNADLSIQDVTDIFSGTKTSWADFGWADGGDINIYERDENSGTHDFFNDFFLDGEEIDPTAVAGHNQQSSTSQLFKLVSEDKGAIGYGGLAYLDESVTALKIDGVEATKTGASSGDYPVARDLYVAYDSDSASDLAKDFLAFVKSTEGQAIVDEVGYVPHVASWTVPNVQTSCPEDQEEVPFNFLTFGVAFVAIIALRRKNC